MDHHSAIVIPDDGTSSDEVEFDVEMRMLEIVDLDEAPRSPSLTPMREINYSHRDTYLQSYRSNGKVFLPGAVVELDDREGPQPRFRGGAFLKLTEIVRNDATGVVKLRGLPLRRCSTFRGIFPRKINEVFFNLKRDNSRDLTPLEQSKVDVDVAEVIGLREMIQTNKPWPIYSGINPNMTDKMVFHNEGRLVCRWEIVTLSTAGNPLKSVEIRRLKASEADIEHSVPDAELYLEWRGEVPRASSRYSYGDAFCGAGGASEGASMAGMDVLWAFDKDLDALSTYRENRIRTNTFNATADQFLALARGDRTFYVDVLHASPPCQPYSPAHTRQGPDDDANQAALLVMEDLISTIRPRVVTIEETFGLITHHPRWFYKLINSMTSNGYSVAWKILNFAEYGLPQARKRVVIFAACPGGILPSFPSPTHGQASDVYPHRTILDALSPLARHPAPRNHSLQNTYNRSRPAYNPRTLLKACITTGGGGNYHPSGFRDFTVRELALLQGFPVDYRFGEGQSKTVITRQIGNAVPPCVAKTLFEAIKMALQREDTGRRDVRRYPQ